MSKYSFSPDEVRFVKDVVSLLTPWGMPQMSARIYGYLLLHSQPVSLDQLTDALEISKSTACVAAKLLEKHLLIRRQGEKGTKRALYVVSDSSTGLLTQKSFLLGEFGHLLDAHAEKIAAGDAAQRMRAIGRFYITMHDAINTLIQEISADSGDVHRPIRAGNSH